MERLRGAATLLLLLGLCLAALGFQQWDRGSRTLEVEEVGQPEIVYISAGHHESGGGFSKPGDWMSPAIPRAGGAGESGGRGARGGRGAASPPRLDIDEGLSRKISSEMAQEVLLIRAEEDARRSAAANMAAFARANQPSISKNGKQGKHGRNVGKEREMVLNRNDGLGNGGGDDSRSLDSMRMPVKTRSPECSQEVAEAVALARSGLSVPRPPGSPHYHGHPRKIPAQGERRVFGWVWAKSFVPAKEREAEMAEIEGMIRNSTLINGVSLVGVVSLVVVEDKSGVQQAALVFNETQYSYYSGVVAACKEHDVEIQILIGELPVVVTDLPPPKTMIHPLSYFVVNPASPDYTISLLAKTSISLAIHHGWAGYNVDDEAYGSPRRAKMDCLLWKRFMDDWADALHCAGLVLTAAIQFTSNMDLLNYTDYLSDTSVDKWVAMDTYYGDLPFFFDQFDWYTNEMADMSKLGIGMFPNGNPTSYEQTMPRVWAMDKVGIDEAWLWLMPLDNKAFPPLLKKWKCGCHGKRLGSCWDPQFKAPEVCGVHSSLPTPASSPKRGARGRGGTKRWLGDAEEEEEGEQQDRAMRGGEEEGVIGEVEQAGGTLAGRLRMA